MHRLETNRLELSELEECNEHHSIGSRRGRIDPGF
jgi:hypothetical protein